MDLTIPSFLFSLFALVISVLNYFNSRNQNRIALKPYLNMIHEVEIKQESNGTRIGILTVTLINNGLGPALIDDVCISVDEKPLPNPRHEHWDAAVIKLFPQGSFGSSVLLAHKSFALGSKYSLPSKDRITLFTAIFKSEDLTDIQRALNRSSMVINFHSFHGDKDVYNSAVERADAGSLIR